MSTPIELDPVLLQNDSSNFLSWSIHVLNAFRAISPLIKHIVDASIPLPIVDWSNYKICQKRKRDACNSTLEQLMSFWVH
jgi:hypothetical protein